MTSDPPPILVRRLVERHYDEVLRFLRRRVPPSDVADLAQEAYARLLRVERKDLIRDPAAYLFTIVANLIRAYYDERRMISEGVQRVANDQSIEAIYRSEEQSADAALIGERLSEALSELTPKCQAVFILTQRDGMTYTEVGDLLDISPSMVKKYLAIALRHCCDRLQDLR